MAPRSVQIGFGLFLAAFMIVTPFVYQSYYNRHFRNVRVVEEGVLYRSAQLSPAGLKRIVHEKGIKTIVCLRHGNKENDIAEEQYANANGIRFVRIVPRRWLKDEAGNAPVEQGLSAWRDVMKNPDNFPVLLHCFAGTHRTGAYIAVYRMDFEGWSNEKAMNELRGLGYVTLDEDMDVFEFLSTYKAVPTARENSRMDRLLFQNEGRGKLTSMPSHLTPERVQGGVTP